MPQNAEFFSGLFVIDLFPHELRDTLLIIVSFYLVLAIEEAVHGRALSSVAAAAVKDSCEVEESEDQQLELCLSLICAVEAVMRKQLFVMRSSTVRRDKIEQLQQTCRGMVVELQSLTRRHDDVDCVGDTRQDLNGTLFGMWWMFGIAE